MTMQKATTALAHALITAATEVADAIDNGPSTVAATLIRDMLAPINPGIVEHYTHDLTNLGHQHHLAEQRLWKTRDGSADAAVWMAERDRLRAEVERLANTAARDWCRAVRIAVRTEQLTTEEQAEISELIANPPEDYRYTDAYNMR